MGVNPVTAPPPPEVVYTRDRSSGRVHIQYRGQSGRLHPHEGCNLDQAGAFEEITAEQLAGIPPEDLCRTDFPVEHRGERE